MVRLLLLAAIAYSIYWFMQPDGCGDPGTLACPDPALEEGVGIKLDAAKICNRKTAGYLCKEHKTFQVARWALDKGKLRVKISPPDFLEGDTARQVHEAAIEGIMEWNNRPFPIEISTNNYPFPRWDIRITWAKGLPSQVGHARLRGEPDGKRFRFSVDGLSVVVPPIMGNDAFVLEPGMSPGEFMVQADNIMRGQPMGPGLLAQVKATAMHEMGHALGLAHSDSENDIMFPQFRPNQTKVRASERDIVTVDALYNLPNGAMVQ